MQDILNMEPLCAEYGMNIVEARFNMTLADCENVINRSLGILVENGFYAMSVYLLSNNVATKDNGYGGRTLRKIVELLSTPELGICTVDDNENSIALLQKLRDVTEDLGKLLLARKLTEETLTFARYHCKALSVLQATQQQAGEG